MDSTERRKKDLIDEVTRNFDAAELVELGVRMIAYADMSQSAQGLGNGIKATWRLQETVLQNEDAVRYDLFLQINEREVKFTHKQAAQMITWQPESATTIPVNDLYDVLG